MYAQQLCTYVHYLSHKGKMKCHWQPCGNRNKNHSYLMLGKNCYGLARLMMVKLDGLRLNSKNG